MGSKERKQEFTLRLPAAEKAPPSLREKMKLQTLHQRGREGAVRKQSLMKVPTFASTRMSPQPLNAGEKAVDFELLANGYIRKGSTLEEQPIDPDDSDQNEFEDIRRVNVFIAAEDVSEICEIVRMSHLELDDETKDPEVVEVLTEDQLRYASALTHREPDPLEPRLMGAAIHFVEKPASQLDWE